MDVLVKSSLIFKPKISYRLVSYKNKNVYNYKSHSPLVPFDVTSCSIREDSPGDSFKPERSFSESNRVGTISFLFDTTVIIYNIKIYEFQVH